MVKSFFGKFVETGPIDPITLNKYMLYFRKYLPRKSEYTEFEIKNFLKLQIDIPFDQQQYLIEEAVRQRLLVEGIFDNRIFYTRGENLH